MSLLKGASRAAKRATSYRALSSCMNRRAASSIASAESQHKVEQALAHLTSINANTEQLLSVDLEHGDPAVYQILQNVNITLLYNLKLELVCLHHTSQEKRRQKHFINLIPSENFTSQAVLDALGSVMQSRFGVSKCGKTIANLE